MRVSVLFVFRVLLYLEQDCTLYNKDTLEYACISVICFGVLLYLEQD